MAAFDGFSTENLVPLPAAFFTDLLPRITNAAELRVTLHVFWLLSHQRGRAKRVRWDDLLADDVLARSLKAIAPLRPSNELIEEGIALAVERGMLLHVVGNAAGRADNWYLVNTAANRAWAERQAGTQVSKPDTHVERPTVFALYEQNIGVLTPMLVEELSIASQHYPLEWIEAALREAVELNIRNWRYVRRILERWETDGRYPAPHRQEQSFDIDKYLTGKYASFFTHASGDE